MPPPNDDFANATVLHNTSGHIKSENFGATSQSGEPTNRGKTVWFKWACPSSGTYIFRTVGSAGNYWTNFRSVIQAFTANNPSSPAVNNLSEVSYAFDQRFGDGNGFENGATIAFDATNATTYWIRVDTREGSEGMMFLSWGGYEEPRLGCGCVNFETSLTECVSIISLEVPDGLVVQTGMSKKYSFGSFKQRAGLYRIQYCSGYMANVSGDSVAQFTFPLAVSTYQEGLDVLASINPLLSAGYRFKPAQKICGKNFVFSATFGCAPLSFFQDVNEVDSVNFGSSSSLSSFQSASLCWVSQPFIATGGEIYTTADLGNPLQIQYGGPTASELVCVTDISGDDFDAVSVSFRKMADANAFTVVEHLTSAGLYQDGFNVGILLTTFEHFDTLLVQAKSDSQVTNTKFCKWNDTSSVPSLMLKYTPMFPSLVFQLGIPEQGPGFDGSIFIPADKCGIHFQVKSNSSTETWPSVKLRLISGVTGIDPGYGNAATFDVPPGSSPVSPSDFFLFSDTVMPYDLNFEVSMSGIFSSFISYTIQPVVSASLQSKTLPDASKALYQIAFTNSGYGTSKHLLYDVTVNNAAVLVAPGNTTPNQVSILNNRVDPIVSDFNGSAGFNSGSSIHSGVFNFVSSRLDGKTQVTFTITLHDDTKVHPPLKITTTL